MENKVRLAIDLLWVKPKNVGGAETVIRTLLDEFCKIPSEYQFILLLSRDNESSFEKYKKCKNFEMKVCNTNTLPLGKRLLWQNISLNKILVECNTDNYFCPVYIRPLVKLRKKKSIIVVHDLQQLHYPEYFTKLRYLWCKYSWKRNIAISDHVVTISQFCKNDIIKNYHTKSDKISVIYNPIASAETFSDFDLLASKYQIKSNAYFYTILSPLKHKNLITLLKVANKKVNQDGERLFKLLISGISGGITNEICEYISKNNLQNNCIMTGYVSDEERNSLIKNCKLFLFPSVFEGFGMPVIEAMQLGKGVITTKCTSIPEISHNKAIYVNNPYDVDEWIKNIEECSSNKTYQKIVFEEYNASYSAHIYLSLFSKIYRNI